MKTYSKLSSIVLLASVALSISSCSKSNSVAPVAPESSATPVGHHVYGLTPTTPEEYANIPVYNKDAFASEHHMDALKAAPAVLTITSPAVRDQGQLGSCTSFSGTYAFEISYYYKHGSMIGSAPAFLYYEERVNILGEKITADNGANMVNIDQALTKYGVCLEADYPYPASDKSTAYKTPPTSAAISQALGYEISAYTLINTGDTAAVKACLRANTAVMFGFNVYDNSAYTIFEGLNTTSYTYSPLTSAGKLKSGLSLLGGHANTIVGYNDTLQAFWVENSWNTTWGNKGYYYLPYSVFSSTKIVPQGGVYYLQAK
jgi:C1A family cysteine protease